MLSTKSYDLCAVDSRDGRIRLLSFRSFFVGELDPFPSLLFQSFKKMISVVHKIIVPFPSISFVFLLNNRSLKSFVSFYRTSSEIVRSIKAPSFTKNLFVLNNFFCSQKRCKPLRLKSSLED